MNLNGEQLTEKEKALVKETARSAVKRYRNQAIVGFVVLLIGISAAFYVRQEDQDQLNRQSATEDAAIINSIKVNCDFGTALRDGVNSIFLRAYGNTEPERARRLAAITGLDPRVIPTNRAPGQRKLTPEQRRTSQIFFERSIIALDEQECHVPKNSKPKS